MEEEVIKTVLNEVLQELKEVKQKHSEIINFANGLKKKVDGFEQKLTEIKFVPPAIDLSPVTSGIYKGLDKVNGAIEAQPKSVRKEFRILLFPEYNATENYKIVFGRLLFWMVVVLVATYLFVLGKHLIDNRTHVKQEEMISTQYKNA